MPSNLQVPLEGVGGGKEARAGKHGVGPKASPRAGDRVGQPHLPRVYRWVVEERGHHHGFRDNAA